MWGPPTPSTRPFTRVTSSRPNFPLGVPAPRFPLPRSSQDICPLRIPFERSWPGHGPIDGRPDELMPTSSIESEFQSDGVVVLSSLLNHVVIVSTADHVRLIPCLAQPYGRLWSIILPYHLLWNSPFLHSFLCEQMVLIIYKSCVFLGWGFSTGLIIMQPVSPSPHV